MFAQFCGAFNRKSAQNIGFVAVFYWGISNESALCINGYFRVLDALMRFSDCEELMSFFVLREVRMMMVLRYFIFFCIFFCLFE